MNLVPFTQELAQQFYESEEQFPINFDDAYQWLGYSRKDVAKRNLQRFKKGCDFSTSEWKKGQRGRSSELIKLSCDCFKLLGMMAETEEGDKIRGYFLECERIAKAAIKHFQNKPQQFDVSQLRKDIDQGLLDITNPTVKARVQKIFAEYYQCCGEVKPVITPSEQIKEREIDFPELPNFAEIIQKDPITRISFSKKLGLCERTLQRWEDEIIAKCSISEEYFKRGRKSRLSKIQQRILAACNFLKSRKGVRITNKHVRDYFDACSVVVLKEINS